MHVCIFLKIPKDILSGSWDSVDIFPINAVWTFYHIVTVLAIHLVRFTLD